MSSLLYSKHAKLIENCYPTITGETSPKSSETSYLLFYASSRPAKLLKVANYLEKRMVNDTYKKRKLDIKVTLAIMNSLLTTCTKDINLFAKGVLKSISLVLDSGDHEIMWEACRTFGEFCIFYDGSALGVDKELTILLDSLVIRFCSFCDASDAETQENVLKMKLLGLKAIGPLMSSELIKTTHARDYFDCIIPSLLVNIKQLEANNSCETQIDETSEVEADLHTVTVDALNLIALKYFKDLIRTCGAANLHIVTELAFKFLDDFNMWHRECYDISLVHFLITEMEPSYRHIVINEILRRLNTCAGGELDQKKVMLASMLASVLTNRTITVGISVLEILNALINHYIKSFNDTSQGIQGFRESLLEAVGGLATHVYYPDQINDILSFIVNKLRLGSREESVDGLSISTLRVALLHCMSIAISKSEKHAQEQSVVCRMGIPFRIISPTLSLFMDANPTVRKSYGLFFLCYLESDIENWNTTSRKLSSKGRLIYRANDPGTEFRTSLHEVIFDYATSNFTLPLDYALILFILKTMVRKFEHEEFVRAIPMLFKLQALNEHTPPEEKLSQQALDQIIASYFLYASEVLDIPQLTTYIEEIITTRKSHEQWYPDLEITMPSNLDGLEGKEFDQMITPKERTTHIPISLDNIKNILSWNSELRQKFSDLEKRLTVDYVPDANGYDFQNTKGRIRTSRIIDGLKPKIAQPSLKKPENISGETKPVKFETLRDALSTVNDSIEVDTDSSDVQSWSRSTTEKSKSVRSNVSDILSKISAKSSNSSLSLVNSPYLTSRIK
ncbi:plasma membrane localization protein [Basidiobolus ranarum]|uniref:Plasma membrane localization protein n=1 Tax=Basidiobolus ranarum TaxID=34480 RepID=A0ABR2WKJ4_9FUNG